MESLCVRFWNRDACSAWPFCCSVVSFRGKPLAVLMCNEIDMSDYYDERSSPLVTITEMMTRQIISLGRE